LQQQFFAGFCSMRSAYSLRDSGDPPKQALGRTVLNERDWRNIAIALTDPDFGEQKAQSGVIA
jgi:hypothetical protein